MILTLTCACQDTKPSSRDSQSTVHEIPTLGISIELPKKFCQIPNDSMATAALVDHLRDSHSAQSMTQFESYIKKSMPSWTQFADTITATTIISIYPYDYTPISKLQANTIGNQLRSRIEQQNSTSNIKAELQSISTGRSSAYEFIKFKISYTDSISSYTNYSYILTRGGHSLAFQVMTTKDDEFDELVAGIH